MELDVSGDCELDDVRQGSAPHFCGRARHMQCPGRGDLTLLAFYIEIGARCSPSLLPTRVAGSTRRHAATTTVRSWCLTRCASAAPREVL
jgi:hypothetical protein